MSDINHLLSCMKRQLEGFLLSYQGVVLAISGGLDSTALFRLFWQIKKENPNFFLALLHINFGLRLKDSDNDQAFIEDIASSTNTPLFVRRVTELEKSQKAGQSTQEWSRTLRYQEFDKYAKKGFLIAMAHHQEDLTESILLRMARGVRTEKLSGMKTYHPPFWRPLLDIPKSQLKNYLDQLGQSYCHDKSNDTIDYARNRVRHKIIPEFEKLHKDAPQKIRHFSQQVEELSHFFNAHLTRLLNTHEKSLPLQLFDGQTDFYKRQLLSIFISKKLPGISLSNRFLNRILLYIEDGKGRFSLEVPGGQYDIECDDSSLFFVTKKAPLSHPNFLRHQRSHNREDKACLVESGSFVRYLNTPAQKTSCTKAASMVHNTSESSVFVRQLTPKSNDTFEIPGHKKKWTMKELFKTNAVHEKNRQGWHLVRVNSQVIGLLKDGKFCQVMPKGLLKFAELDEIEIYSQ